MRDQIGVVDNQVARLAEACGGVELKYQEKHTVSALKGAPPGYVGYGKGGVLTEAVRKRPYSVILLDEVEKAHHDVHEVFFQVFDKGCMEDGTGRSIDFKNTLILLTSNVGTEEIVEACARAGRRPDPEVLERALDAPLRRMFPAALIGRITAIPYYPLDAAMIDRIAQLQLGRIAERVRAQHRAELLYDDSFVRFIRQRCTDSQSGARAIDRILSNQLLPRLGRELLTRSLDGRAVQSIQLTAGETDFTCTFRES